MLLTLVISNIITMRNARAQRPRADAGRDQACADLGDVDEPPPATIDHDLDAAHAGIERLADAFLDRARRGAAA
jgi:HAMP domain-containing protein